MAIYVPVENEARKREGFTDLLDLQVNTILRTEHRDASTQSIHFAHRFPCRTIRQADLIETGDKAQVNLPALLYTAWAILLQRYLRTQEVLFAAYDLTCEKEMLLRIEAEQEATLGQLLKQVQQKVDVHPDLSLRELLTEIGLAAGERPFNTAVVICGAAGVPLQASVFEQGYDLVLTAEIGETIVLEATYDTQHFQQSIVEGICRHFARVLTALVEDMQTKMQEVRLLSEEEIERILHDFNPAWTGETSHETVVQRFERQVKQSPDRVAVVFRDEKITYRDLQEKANRLASVLQKRGVTSDRLVGILCEPSIDLLVAIFAVLKAGGAYLPVDVTYPKERIRTILQDSQAGWLLAKSLDTGDVSFAGEILSIDASEGEAENLPPVCQAPAPHDLAYMIYTSGSTGTPKGVMIEHRSLLQLVDWHLDSFDVTAHDNATKYAGVGFDASVWEVFPSLVSGATLHIIPDEIRYDVMALNEYFHKHNITISFLPTQLCELFLELPNESLRVLLTGGDKLKKWKKQPYKLVNCYGPTENTVVTTSFEVRDAYENIPIGKPVRHAQVLILDAYNHLQPIGFPGELCIAGQGLARGYWNRPELTQAKFVPHALHPDRIMYRTGDLARWLPDGTIEFLGRIDHQVKIRGFRVETGEIEQKLLQHEAIESAVVIAREDESGNNALCAYYVAVREVAVEEIASFLGRHLPGYMIPARFMRLDVLPINANGKVDLRFLPEPPLEPDCTLFQAPATQTEAALARIWEETLGVSTVGVQDEFTRLGGHSLQVATLQNRIEMRLHVRVPMPTLFELTTIREQANWIERAGRQQQSAKTLVPVGKRPQYAASPAQKRLYLIEQFQEVQVAYNAPMVMRIEGTVDIARMENAFLRLVERHEALRTSFEFAEDRLVQIVQEHVPFALQVFHGTEVDIEQLMHRFVQRFDLAQAPLFRAGLYRVEDGRVADDLHFLLLDFHHIVVDGVSMHVFFDEWSRLYRGEELAERPPLRFVDVAEWQNTAEHRARIERHEPFWRDLLTGELPVLQLPTDKPRPAKRSYRGETRSIWLDAELTEDVRLFAKETGTTLFMVLFAAYKVLLARYANQEDVIVGVPVANRNQADLQAVIGMFVNTLPVRSFPEPGKSFAAYLQEVKQVLLAAFEHQEYELEQVVQALNIPRDPSRNPLFDTMFVMQNTGMLQVEMQEADVTLYPYFHPTAKYDLLVQVTEAQDAIRIDLESCTDLFFAETVERFARHLVALLRQVRTLGERKLAEIALLSPEEVDEQVNGLQQTESRYDVNATIHQLFEVQVQKTPDRVALSFGEQSLTYRELNERANRLAVTLRGKGVQRDQVVGLLVDRSLEMIVGLLGILKAGGAYVPIDPEYPADRVTYMLQHSGASLLLTQTFLLQDLPFAGEVICLDREEAYGEATDNLDNVNEPQDLLYVIYTSGTTGKPKGVMIEHRNFVNLIHFEYTRTNVDFSEDVLQFTTMSFDVCSQEIWSTLLAGGTLHLITNELKHNVGALLELIAAKRIRVLFMPVSLLKFVLHEKEYVHKFPTSVRHIITAGEQLIVPETFRTFLQAHGIYLHNHYGPSETHLCTALTLDPQAEMPEVPPIGYPLTNTKLYLLNESLQMQPLGVAGEIYIAGDCVGRGYLNNREMTEARYLPDPFAGQGRMYKSGDLGRWNPDGTVEYLGRLDHQVKIRGFRIELGEVESHLLNHPAISETIVVALEDGNGGKFLCAYYVAAAELGIAELRSHLAQGLSDYMIPSCFVWLATMPITPNGKIDRRALPQPDRQQAVSKHSVLPRNETERKIAGVWEDVLNVAEIGVHDNFFELGGHSLKAAVVVTRLQKEFELSMNDLFACQTVALLAGKVKRKADHLQSRLERLKIEQQAEVCDDLSAEWAVYAEKNRSYADIDLTEQHRFQAVLLTGATGYVGIHLLHELMQATSWDVHLIVRGKSQAEAAERLRRKWAFSFGASPTPEVAERLHVQAGDLTEPQFGLAAELYEELSQTVDCVIHSAATVKHYGDADFFAKQNVETTRHLLDFALHHKHKVFHHISTLGVATGQVPERAAVSFTEYDLDIGQQFENHYAKSKWEAERHVVEARRHGLNTNIHRLGNIVFHSQTGRFQENIAENAFYTLLNAFVRFGKAPRMGADVDFTYVDAVSQAIVALVERKRLENETYHLFNPHRTRYSDVLTSEGFQSEVAACPFAEFLDELAAKSEEDAYRGAVSDILLHFGWLEESSDRQTRFHIAADKTNALLDRIGLKWKPLDEAMIRLMFNYGKQVGFWC